VETAKAADLERAREQNQFNKKWIGPEPILRLIHTLIDHNDIKRAYLKRFDLPSDRMALENRNTPQAKASTVWAMMSDMWNDPFFVPSTILMGHLHSDFSLPIVIDHVIVSDMAVATPEKVKDKWAGLIHKCKRIVEKWERSGQGDGGYDDLDDEDNDEEDRDDGDEDGGKGERVFGSLKNRSQRALDSRSSFFVNKEPYLLYLWEVLDNHDLLIPPCRGSTLVHLRPMAPMESLRSLAKISLAMKATMSRWEQGAIVMSDVTSLRQRNLKNCQPPSKTMGTRLFLPQR
jgi:hypothetical protein